MEIGSAAAPKKKAGETELQGEEGEAAGCRRRGSRVQEAM